MTAAPAAASIQFRPSVRACTSRAITLATPHAAIAARGHRAEWCPAILPCNNDECTIRPLPGLGYNAAIVQATASLRNAWVGWPSTAVYIAADRFDQTNPRVACSNPATHEAFNHLMHSGTALSFLDRNFTVVKRTFVTGGKCAAGRFTKSLVKSARMVTDSRLIELGRDEIWLQHASHWPTGNCNGSWIAKLTHFAKYVCPQQGTEAQSVADAEAIKTAVQGAELHGYKQIKSAEGPYTVLQPTEYVGGVGLEFISHSNRTGRLAAMIQAQQSASSNPFLLFDTSGLHRLTAERNGGIVLSNVGTRQPLYEIVNVAPELQLRAPNGQYTYHKLPPGFAKIGMHNSASIRFGCQSLVSTYAWVIVIMATVRMKGRGQAQCPLPIRLVLSPDLLHALSTRLLGEALLARVLLSEP